MGRDAERGGRGHGSGTAPVVGVGARLGRFGPGGGLEYARLDADENGDRDLVIAGVIDTY